MPVARNEEPVDRLGVIADRMLETLHQLANTEGVRAVVFLENDLRAMTALDGWEEDTHAIAAVFAHLAAVFEANGKKLMIMPIGGD